VLRYHDLIRLDIQRFKETDRRIGVYWSISLDKSIPESLSPGYWSKDLLHLLPTLGNHKSHEEIIALSKVQRKAYVRDSNKHGMFPLIASDVE
jgi:hypothetical protein